MRTIELHTKQSLIGRECKPLRDALAYLTMWAFESDKSDTVKIYDDCGRDIVAVYFNAKGERFYTIGAVWRESSSAYTFHS